MSRRLAVASAVAGALALTACTGQGPDHPAVHTPPPSPTVGDATAESSAASRSVNSGSLTCDDGQGTDASTDRQSGMSSMGWNLRAVTPIRDQPSSGGRTFIKSPLIVSPTVKRGTIVRVLSPKDAALFYTSFSVWSHHPPEISEIIATARRQVAVEGCQGAPRAEMYPGGYVIDGPSCLVVEIVAPDTRRTVVKAPMGKRCS